MMRDTPLANPSHRGGAQSHIQVRKLEGNKYWVNFSHRRICLYPEYSLKVLSLTVLIANSGAAQLRHSTEAVEGCGVDVRSEQEPNQGASLVMVQPSDSRVTASR